MTTEPSSSGGDGDEPPSPKVEILHQIEFLENEIRRDQDELKLTPGALVNGIFLLFSVGAGFSGIIAAVIEREPWGLAITFIGFLGAIWSIRGFAKGFEKRNQLKLRQVERQIRIQRLNYQIPDE